MNQLSSFSQEDANILISRALKTRYRDAESVTFEDLVTAAAQFGVEEEDLRREAKRLREERSRLETERNERRRKRQQVIFHIIVFVAVNAGLLIHNQYYGGDIPLHWVFLGWGIGLTAHVLEDWFGWDIGDGNDGKGLDGSRIA